ncbi:pentatricopeptide repeat-containing protein At2g37320-like [Malus domestica]|uniref:pentatricopeptide repeat-containing protein At2g37320-like n=1 Tax=Malus domestica TaxID=3750 RepID=UPI003975F620
MVHCVTIQMGFGMDVYFGNTMIYFYVKCGGHGYSHKLFDEMSQRDLLSWTSTISGYVLKGMLPNSIYRMYAKLCTVDEVEDFFSELARRDVGKVAPGIETLTLVISAVTKDGILSQGESLNCVAIKRGLRDHVLQKSLLDLYAKRGELGNSYWLFRAIPRGNGITWGAMMFGFIQSGWFSEAVGLFREMQDSVRNQGLRY